jgi:hypothetical protein
MVRRILLGVVLVVLGLALVNAAAVQELPGGWVPDALVTAQRTVGAEGAVVGGVFGLGLLLAALSPLRYRLWVVLAIVYGALSVAVQVDRYYRGLGDVVPPIVFWVAGTALLMALFPTRGRGPAGVRAPPPRLSPTAGAQTPNRPT